MAEIKAEPGMTSITGQPVGFTIEGPDTPEGRTVDTKPASGGRSISSTDDTGTITADLEGPLESGRQGEWHVLKTLKTALRAKGHKVEDDKKRPPVDSQGEDGALLIDGERVVVQVVTLPVDRDTWKELRSAGASSLKGIAIQIIRDGLAQKKGKAAGTILTLDVSSLGAITGESAVQGYIETYGDPEAEFRLRQAWLVGPTVGSTRRLK